jgi:SAM-dependent methyltransferase
MADMELMKNFHEPVSETTGDVRVRKHFDTNTDLYVDTYKAAYEAICEERIGQLERFLGVPSGEPLTVLDVGCGAGRFLDMLLDKYPHSRAFGVDSSQGMLNRNTLGPRKKLILSDAKELPFRPNTFDLINVDALMHHLIDYRSYGNTLGTIERFLSTTRKLLKPDGLMVVREIYHEFVLRDDFGPRLVYELSTLQMPAVVATLLKRLGLITANAGVCFLTRRQWEKMFKRTRYEVLQVTQKPWIKHPFEKIGFRFNGDLYYTVRRQAAEIDLDTAKLDRDGPSLECVRV